MSNHLEWARAHCPICGEEYRYIAKVHIPVTCGKYKCVQDAVKRGLLEKRENRDIQ